MRWGAVLAAAALTVAACGNDDDSSNTAACLEAVGIAEDMRDGITRDLPRRWERVVQLSRGTQMHEYALAALEAARPPLNERRLAAAMNAMWDVC